MKDDPTWFRFMGMLAILLADWGTAASHMAFTSFTFYDFYAQPNIIWGDIWHAVAGLRYGALLTLAILLFEKEWRWYMVTGGLNWIGWQTLKALHGKEWGWGVWERWL